MNNFFQSFLKMTPFNLIILVCVLSIMINWVLSAFGSLGYNWDVDHMMYSGQRLLEGEFNWTVEFLDKLPILQILFVLPAYYESVLVWFFISTVFIVLGSWACYDLVDNILLNDPSISSVDRIYAASLASLSMVFLFLFLPGGIHHINPISASFAVISVSLLFRSLNVNYKFFSFLPFLISSFSASISIGVRPHFFFALIFASALLILNQSKNLPNRYTNLTLVAFWIILVGIFGFLINVVPYMIIGELEVFFAGISLLSQNVIPQNFLETIDAFVRVFFQQSPFVTGIILLSVTTSIYAIIILIKSNDKNLKEKTILINVIILTFILPLFLLTLILIKHFWSHYLQLFVPFFALGIGFFFIFFKQLVEKQFKKNSILIWSLTISIILIYLLPLTLKDLVYFNKNKKDSVLISKISNIINERPEGQRDFLFLNDIRTHWILNESRYGFPNAANTQHIIERKWWQNISMPNHFRHPISSDEYCEMLEEKGPTLLLIKNLEDFELVCLRKSNLYIFNQKVSQEVSLFIRN